MATNTMRAMVIERTGAPSEFVEAAVPYPERVDAEVLVRVMAAGVNRIDSEARAGRGDSGGIPSFPAVLGHDFSGVVVESPYAAHPLRPGDAVYGMAPSPRGAGSYAEFVSVPALNVARKPASLSHVEAAGVPVAALTAWGMTVDVGKAHEGQRMLIHAGAGGVGHLAVQFASYFGAHVIATGSHRNSGWLRELGAAEVVDYCSADFERTVRDVDVVVNLVDDVEVAARSFGVLRPSGMVVHAPAASWPAVSARAVASGVRATGYAVTPDAATLAVIARLLDSGDVRVYIDDVYDLGEAADAHARLEQRHTRGKLVLRVTDE
ncbi:NADP-dependent oxidoreductase [Frigoribacterium sp. 2-23]|uniref:NADP-dependent oxidoreductase n=1 Tax=Frigoribacterium sp. 2-23 TaxID=3415006 RepID=UPI003C6F0B97